MRLERITTPSLVIAFLLAVASIVASAVYPINPIFMILLVIIIGCLDVFARTQTDKQRELKESDVARIQELERKVNDLERLAQMTKVTLR